MKFPIKGYFLSPDIIKDSITKPIIGDFTSRRYCQLQGPYSWPSEIHSLCRSGGPILLSDSVREPILGKVSVKYQ